MSNDTFESKKTTLLKLDPKIAPKSIKTAIAATPIPAIKLAPNTAKLVKTVTAADVLPSFAALKLDPNLLKALAEAGYTSPTPIQAATIPIVLAKGDLMGTAQTGTGKTAAFILPALQHLLSPRTHTTAPRVLVLVPTRELAMQVEEASKKYSRYSRSVRVVSILGGMDYGPQLRNLSQAVDILIATPGRLIDHLERGRLNLAHLEMLVLDEADRMLDMGFLDAVKHIAAATPKNRQTLMFSATFDQPIAKLAQQLLKNPERVEMASQQMRHTQIEQRLHYADDFAHKRQILFHLLKDTSLDRTIIFTASKRGADKLAQTIWDQGLAVGALHGGMQQRARLRTLNDLRTGKVRILVATDVAARGIDVAGISHIFNYDLPRSAEDYVHRIGRTGRAGAFGTAIALAMVEEQSLVKRIERFIGHSIPASVIPGLEPQRSLQSLPPGKRKGGRPSYSKRGSESKFKPQNGYYTNDRSDRHSGYSHAGAKNNKPAHPGSNRFADKPQRRRKPNAEAVN
jgi:superfamily II DNA/RNA helicase